MVSAKAVRELKVKNIYALHTDHAFINNKTKNEKKTKGHFDVKFDSGSGFRF